MSNQILYTISPGEGLKIHLSVDPEGVDTVCGRRITLSTKSVSEVEPYKFRIMLMVMGGAYCQTCLKKVGLID